MCDFLLSTVSQLLQLGLTRVVPTLIRTKFLVNCYFTGIHARDDKNSAYDNLNEKSCEIAFHSFCDWE